MSNQNREKEEELLRDNCGFLSSEDVRTNLVSGPAFSNKEVTYSVVDGLAVYEGCIVLGKADHLENQLIEDGSPQNLAEGVVITGNRYRWPNALVPYQVDSGVSDKYRITDAISHWETKTRIRFVKRTHENAGEYPNYINFVPANGCWSYVGMQGGRQEIGLSSRCSTGNTIHEIGHALGLWHEQSREDRNSHVEIHYENIREQNIHNFNQHISDGDDIGSHDFDSIMHYGKYAFSKNGLPTITTKPPGKPIGQRLGLSDGDVATIHAIYEL